MSHFYLVVLVPEHAKGRPAIPKDPTTWTGETEQHINSFIAEQMVRYDEDKDVPEYDRGCWCVGRAAAVAGRDAAEEALPAEQCRTQLKARLEKDHPSIYKKYAAGPFSLDADEDELVKQIWAEFTAPRTETAEAVCAAHPLYQKPDPKCTDCSGAGTYRSTYNPEAKWDWYVIGGRWDGAIQEVCTHAASFPANVVPVSMVLESWEPKHAPLAILTPDGEWHEQGAVGGFGEFRCTPHDLAQWRDAAKRIFEMHMDCLAVGVDCHI